MQIFYKINIQKQAQKDLETLSKNKKLITKALQIIDEIILDPYSQSHKFERLKHEYSGFCSKRLDKKNRIIYQVKELEVIIVLVSILGHYD